MAALGDQGIASCSNTGITIPECSCQVCLEEQIRTYRPSVLGAAVEVLEAGPGSGTLAEIPRATGAPAAPELPNLKAA